MSNYVFVLDTNHVPQAPVHPAVARKLLTARQAAVWRRYPFTLILQEAGPAPLGVPSHRLKIDPGSQTTGFALLDGAHVIWAAELTHRGEQIKARLDTRRAIRRHRRQRKTRYRQARFLNRMRPSRWLAPSLQHRVDTTLTWVRRLACLCPLSALSMERVRFDTQALQNPEIAGVAYQQGTLAGYEVREYLLEKWQRTCAYCGRRNVPLQIEHMVPRSRGGSDRISNLTLACQGCNAAKGTQTAAEFGHPGVQQQVLRPLRNAAAVNSTRWALSQALAQTGLPVECGTGGRTKYNRQRLGVPKTHCGDAACVGASTPASLVFATMHPLQITATGHGIRQRCRTDAHGFPVAHRARRKRFFGFQTGDLVKAVVPKKLL